MPMTISEKKSKDTNKNTDRNYLTPRKRAGHFGEGKIYDYYKKKSVSEGGGIGAKIAREGGGRVMVPLP